MTFDFSYYFLWTTCFLCLYLFIFTTWLLILVTYYFLLTIWLFLLYFCYTVHFYLDMFVINNTVFSINLSILIKRALFTYKPVVPNCMYNRIITQEPNFKSGNIPRPWAIENLWSLPNFSSTRGVLKLFSTQLFTLFKDHSKPFLCFFS